MSPEPAELQILRQVLGHDLGSMVFGLNTMAASCAQLGQQIGEQAQMIEQMQATPSDEPPAAPVTDGNPWTETDHAREES